MKTFIGPMLSAMLLAAAVSCSGTHQGTRALAVADPPVVVEMTAGLEFKPASVTIDVGQTVQWHNGSYMVHTVTDDPAKAVNNEDAQLPKGAEPFDSGEIQPGATWSHTFTVPGQYRYFCRPHETSRMVGEVVVGPRGGP